MWLRRWIALLLFSSSSSLAEEIRFEIYEISRIGNRLLASGTRTYSIQDLEIHPYAGGGPWAADKLIELENGYRIGASIYQEKELTGFGLVAQRTNSDFSWNWYEKVGGSRFKQLIGETIVDVSVYGQPFFEELVEVRFLEDAKLRFKAARAREDTHHVIVKAGSVLRFR